MKTIVLLSSHQFKRIYVCTCVSKCTVDITDVSRLMVKEQNKAKRNSKGKNEKSLLLPPPPP